MSWTAVCAGWRRRCRARGLSRPELGAEALEAMDARIARMLAPLPDPDSPDWTPAHHAVLVEAAALNRRRWAASAGAEPGHDLLADPEAVVQVARILREAGVV